MNVNMRNDRDRMLQEASSRIANLGNARVTVTATPLFFHVLATGAVEDDTIDLDATLLGLTGEVTWGCAGGTLTQIAGATAKLTYANMTGPVATVTASVMRAGYPVVGTAAITKISDGASVKGDKGDSGPAGDKNSVAFLYRWSTTAPAKPNSGSTFGWAQNANTAYAGTDGWSIAVPNNPGTPGLKLFTVRVPVTAAAAATSTAIPASAYANASVEVWSQNGENGGEGDPGAPGAQIATALIYQWAATIPAGPVGSASLTWADGKFGAAPTNWTLVPGNSPSPGMTLWQGRVQVIGTAGTVSTPFNWTSTSITPIGYAGTNGTNGTAQYVEISTSGGQVFSRATAAATFAPTSITLAATAYGGSATYLWQYWTGSAWTNAGSTTATLAVASGAFAGSRVYRVQATIGADTHYDEMTLTQLTGGADGVNAISGWLTNESVTLVATSAGAVSDFSTAGGTFKVYDGIVDKTGTAVAYSVSSETGCDVSITTAGVYSVASMSADQATAVLQAIYGSVTIQKVLNLSKAKAGVSTPGAEGVSYVTAYCASASLSTTTAPAATTGRDSVPAVNGGGITGTWSKTVPALTGSQFMYQSDGLYNPANNTVTWSIPYWSSLKVATLSAIVANLGAITGGSIDIGTGATSWHVDAAGNMWIGAATFAAAPFRVSNAGAVTASNMTLTAGSVVGGTDVGLLASRALSGETALNTVNHPTEGLAQRLRAAGNQNLSGPITLYSAGAIQVGTASNGTIISAVGITSTKGGQTNYSMSSTGDVIMRSVQILGANGEVIFRSGVSLAQQASSNPNLCPTPRGFPTLSNGASANRNGDGRFGDGQYLVLPTSPDSRYVGADSPPLGIPWGAYYTVSFDAYCEGAHRFLNVDIVNSQDWDSNGIGVTLTNVMTRYTFVEGAVGSANAPNGRLRMFTTAPGGSPIIIANIKVELGTTVTPWCDSIITADNAKTMVMPNSINNTMIGGDLFSTNWNWDASPNGRGWRIAREGTIWCNDIRVRGNIMGGWYNGWAWPTTKNQNGQSYDGGFYIGSEGALFGNHSNNRFVQIYENGDLSTPNLKITGGIVTVKGEINGSSIRTSVLGMESARIMTAWNRVAPMSINDYGAVMNNNLSSKIVTLTDFCGPVYDAENTYYPKRFGSFRKDVFIKVNVHGDTSWETLLIEVEYHKNGGWGEITRASADLYYGRGFSVITRYTPWAQGWDWIAFRARTISGKTLSITMEVQIFNFNESTSGENTSTGIVGSDAPPPPAPPPREDWCVDRETTKLPSGKYARDASVNDLLECWNFDGENPGIEYAPVSIIRFGEEESTMVCTENGVQIIQSNSTPMLLRDGTHVCTPELLGHQVLVKRGDSLEWEVVTQLFPMGVREVVKISLNDRMFFAGMDHKATIATHNVQQKP